jgi:hypothetical protein
MYSFDNKISGYVERKYGNQDDDGDPYKLFQEYGILLAKTEPDKPFHKNRIETIDHNNYFVPKLQSFEEKLIAINVCRGCRVPGAGC